MPEGQRTFMGFDYGKQRIGLAIAQEVTGTANPLITIKAINHKPDWDNITKIIKEWQPDLFVVGLPLHMDGTEQEMTQAAKKFANQLNGRYQIPVELMDERLTSDEADTLLKQQKNLHKHPKSNSPGLFQDKGQIDMISAQLILQSWISQQQMDS